MEKVKDEKFGEITMADKLSLEFATKTVNALKPDIIKKKRIVYLENTPENMALVEEKYNQ